MTAAEARARCPSLSTALVDPSRIESLAGTIVESLLVVSPRIGRGLSAAFGGAIDAHEHSLFFVEVESSSDVDRLAGVVRDLDLGPASIGVADGAFAASCAACTIEAKRGAVRRKVVPRGGDASFLGPLSSKLLPASPAAAEAIGALGLATMAHVAALPNEGVQARFGEEGRRLVALASGVALPAVATYVPSREPSTEIDLVDPADASNEGALTLDAVLFGLRACCLRLVPPLAASGLGAAEVEIVLEGRRGKSTRIEVRPARPEIDAHALFELARATLDGTLRPRFDRSDDDDGVGPIARLRVTATTLVPIVAEGEKLPFARRDAHVLPFDVALARLRGRFGSDRVLTPVRHEDPRPEGRGSFRPATTRNVRESIARTREPVPLRERLRAPSPAVGVVILSRAPIPGDPWPLRAARAKDPRAVRPVVQEVGPPERVASGWWSAPYDLVYRWVVSNEGVRALFARAAEEGGWKLVGVAD